jgi:hypothetical protein
MRTTTVTCDFPGGHKGGPGGVPCLSGLTTLEDAYKRGWIKLDLQSDNKPLVKYYCPAHACRVKDFFWDGDGSEPL